MSFRPDKSVSSFYSAEKMPYRCEQTGIARIIGKQQKSRKLLSLRAEKDFLFPRSLPAIIDANATLPRSDVAPIERGKAKTRGKVDLRALFFALRHAALFPQLPQEKAAQ